MKGTEHICPQYARESIRIDVRIRRLLFDYAGVVDQGSQRTQRCFCFVEQLVNLLFIAHVRGDGDC